jgi:hypothetical protein
MRPKFVYRRGVGANRRLGQRLSVLRFFGRQESWICPISESNTQLAVDDIQPVSRRAAPPRRPPPPGPRPAPLQDRWPPYDHDRQPLLARSCQLQWRWRQRRCPSWPGRRWPSLSWPAAVPFYLGFGVSHSVQECAPNSSRLNREYVKSGASLAHSAPYGLSGSGRSRGDTPSSR